MNVPIKHAKCARINVFDFKKIWKSCETYNVFQDLRKLANGCNVIQGYPASDCDA